MDKNLLNISATAMKDQVLATQIRRYAAIHGKSVSSVISMAFSYFLEMQADVLALAAMEVLATDAEMETQAWISLQENDPFQASRCFE